MDSDKTNIDYKRKYNEALEWMRSLYDGLHGPTKEDAEHYFPELTESEDERIKKEILSFLKDFKRDHYRNLDFSSWIAWLEKQGEQKPTDLRTWKYIVADVLTAKNGIGQYLDDPWTTEVAERLQERFGNIKQKSVDVKPHIPDGSTDYDKGYEEAQRYLSERGFDIPWNDGDVFVDERYVSQTVANVLAWGDEHPKQNLEKQGEQILANSAKTCKNEPKFQIGDWVILGNSHNSLYQIEKIENYKYYLRHYLGGAMPLNFSDEKDLKLWTIDDTKEGDVLAIGNEYFLFKGKVKNTSRTVYNSYCFCNSAKAFIVANEKDCGEFFPMENGIRIHPATKEQRNTLFAKMKKAGYEWDDEKRELRNIGKTSSNWSEVDNVRLDEAIQMVESNGTWVRSDDAVKLVSDWLKSLKEKLTETKGGEI